MTRFVLHTLAWLVLAAVGCGSNGVVPCFAGDESCACYANGTCNVGLSCEAQHCVGAAESDDPQEIGQRDANASDSGSTASRAAGEDAVATDAHSAGRGADQSAGRAAAAPSGGSAGTRAAVVLPSVSASSPRKNAETCTLAKDCASGFCEKNKLGELHCYGTAGPNEPCRDEFDCQGGWCVGVASDTGERACVDGLAACDDRGLSGSCTEHLAIATCQLNELCDQPKSRLDFNSCVRYGCEYWHDNPPANGCESQLSFARGGKVNCSKE